MTTKVNLPISIVKKSDHGVKWYCNFKSNDYCVAQVYYSDPSEYEDEDDDEKEDPCWVGQVSIDTFLSPEGKFIFNVSSHESMEEAKLTVLYKLKEIGFDGVKYI